MSDISEIRLTKKSMKIMLISNIKTTGKKTVYTLDMLYWGNYLRIDDLLESKTQFLPYYYNEVDNRLFFCDIISRKVTEIIKVTHKKEVLFYNNNNHSKQ